MIAVLLTGGLNLWLESAFNYKITQKSEMICKIFPFFTYTMLDYSVIIIVIMTSKKLYAVLYPIRANKLNTNKKELLTAFSALLLSCLINSHFLLSLRLVEYNSTVSFINSTIYVCTNSKWDIFYQNYWIYIDATVYSFLPFALITIFNISIVLCLIKQKRNRNKLQSLKFKKPQTIFIHKNANKEDSLSSYILRSYIPKNVRLQRRMAIVEYNQEDIIAKIAFCYIKRSSTENNRRLTIMLFLINISFSILTMPIVILQIINQIRINNMIKSIATEDTTFIDRNGVFDLLKAIFEILQYLNHGINFILYCLSGSTFRRETMIILENVVKFLFSKCF